MADFAQRRTMMVDTQVRPNDVTKFPIIEAMLTIPREVFVPPARRDAAYIGENLAIGDGRYLLEARTLAKMIEGLDIQPTDLVLDVGCGLGYSSAVIARMAEAVVAIEENTSMAEQAQELLSAENVFNVAVLQAPLAEGCPKQAPFDAIVIGGGVEQVPTALTSQLKEGGRIAAIFKEGALGSVRIGWMLDGQINWRFAFHANAPILPGFEQVKGFSF